MKKYIALALALVFMVPVLAGCGCSPSIKTDQGEISLKDGGLQVKGNDGSTSSVAVGDGENAVSLPDDYPKDIVPIDDGATITSAMRNETADKKATFWVSYSSDKAAKDLYTYYQDALKDATETQKYEINGTYSMTGVKAENKFSVTVGSEQKDGKNVSTVIITIEPNA